MAIQFHCPSCEAMIRVPDASAGKKGTCPRCNEKLLVPDVAAAPSTSVPSAPSPPGQTGSDHIGLPGLDFGTPSNQRAETPHPGGFPDVTAARSRNIDTADPNQPVGLPRLETETPASIALGLQRKTRSKQRKSSGSWIVPVLCLLGMVGFLAWYTWKSQPKLEGDLVAHTVREMEIVPAFLSGELSKLDKADLDEVLRHLKADPTVWTSSISKFTFTGTDSGVEVSVRNGSAAHFVSILPGQNATLVAYIKEHTSELDRARLAAIEQHAPALFAAWKRQYDKHESLSNQKELRDLVAQPTLVSGLGYHLEAVANGNIYPCAYEDEAGTLYFLIPNATKSFKVQGRKVAGSTQVPANFSVKIAGAARAASPSKSSKAKTPVEREAENDGMNPDLYKLKLEEGLPLVEGDALGKGSGDMQSTETSDDAMSKPKSKRKKPAMMLEEDEEMMNDEMPAKSLPKKKPAAK